jgi:hypothetical protein
MALTPPWCRSGHTTAVLISKLSVEGTPRGDPRATSLLLKVLLLYARRPLRAECRLRAFVANSLLPGCRIFVMDI